MYVPVFRKTVTSTNLSSIAVAIGYIVSFDKSSVNHLANRRCLYRSFHFGFAAKKWPADQSLLLDLFGASCEQWHISNPLLQHAENLWVALR